MKTSTRCLTTLKVSLLSKKTTNNHFFRKVRLQVLSLLLIITVLSVTNIKAQLSTYPTTIDFRATMPTYITTPSGTSYNTNLTNCSSTVTGGISYTSSSKFWTLLATKCARVIYTIKQASTVRAVTVSNDKNSVTKTTTGTSNACITDTVDFNYDGSLGNVTIKFAGASGGSSEAVIAVTVYDAIVLPVTFTSFKVAQQNNTVGINWSVGSEVNISKYVVEKSTDAITFNEIGNISVEGSSNYSWVDVKPSNNDVFYRIKAVETTGTNIYSNVLKINTSNTITDVTIGPNPVISSRFALQLKALAKGDYTVNIYNSIGQVVYRATLNHAGGTATESIQLPASIKKGIYTLSLSNSSLKINKTLFINQ